MAAGFFACTASSALDAAEEGLAAEGLAAEGLIAEGLIAKGLAALLAASVLGEEASKAGAFSGADFFAGVLTDDLVACALADAAFRVDAAAALPAFADVV